MGGFFRFAALAGRLPRVLFDPTLLLKTTGGHRVRGSAHRRLATREERRGRQRRLWRR